MGDFLNRWTVSMASGGKPLVLPGTRSFPAVASLDGKHLIVLLHHQLRVYFLHTRQCIRTVDVDLTGVRAVHLDPHNGLQLVAFTGREVLYINWKEKLDRPVVAAQQLAPALPDLAEVYSVQQNGYFALLAADGGVLLHFIDREHATTSLVAAIDNVCAYAVSQDGQKLAVAEERECVALYDLLAAAAAAQRADTEQLQAQLRSAADTIAASKETQALAARPVTCMAVSNGGVIAAGSMSGAINLIYGGTSAGMPQRTLRWHIEPPRAVCFSANEQYLVLGGLEKVLVFWHLDLDRVQHLPRLLGPIDGIFVDANRVDHYSVALRVGAGAHELVVILAVDLVSRLAVSPVRPRFNMSARHAVSKMVRKMLDGRGNPRLVSYDVSAPVVPHPTTRHLYLARGPAIQAFDVVRGEQAFVQHAAPQLSTGRVRSERKLVDPEVTAVAFSSDGAWMATFDSMPALDFDNLLSKHDTAYALKFWRWADSEWELALKIVDPHGPGVDVGAVVPALSGLEFTTLDKLGGIRVWRPRAGTAEKTKTGAQTAWSLRRASAAVGAAAPVAGCFSADSSLLVVSHGRTISVYDPTLLQTVPLRLPALELSVEMLAILGNYLIIASLHKLILFDLVAGTLTALAGRVSTLGQRNFIAVDHARQLIAVAINHFETEPELHMEGKISIFRPDDIKPLCSIHHKLGIASLVATASEFVFVDVDSRVGVVAPEAKKVVGEFAEDDLAAQMDKMLVSAQAAANMLYSRALDEKLQQENTEDPDKWTSHKVVDVATLLPVFANVEGVSLDSLFERVVRAVQ